MKKFSLIVSVMLFLLITTTTSYSFTLYWKSGRTQPIKEIKIKEDTVECRETEKGLWFEAEKSTIDLGKTLASKKQEEDERAEEEYYRTQFGTPAAWELNKANYKLIKHWVDSKEIRKIKEDSKELGLKKGNYAKIIKLERDKESATVAYLSSDNILYEKVCPLNLLMTREEYEGLLREEERKRIEEEKEIYKEKVGDFIWDNNYENYEMIKQWVDAENYLRVIADDAALGLKKGQKVIQAKGLPEEGKIEIISLNESGRLTPLLYDATLIKTEEEYLQILEAESKTEKEKDLYRKKAGEKIWKANQGNLKLIKEWYENKNFKRLLSNFDNLKIGDQIRIKEELDYEYEIIYLNKENKISTARIMKMKTEDEEEYKERLIYRKNVENEYQENKRKIDRENALREKQINTYPPNIRQKIRDRKIWIGMDKDMAILSWGKPKDINRTVGRWGVHEQWVYSDGTYVYFENGVLTSWQD